MVAVYRSVQYGCCLHVIRYGCCLQVIQYGCCLQVSPIWLLFTGHPIWLLFTGQSNMAAVYRSCNMAAVYRSSNMAAFCLFVMLFLNIGCVMADFIKCELSGGGPPRLLDTSLYTHINTCHALLPLLTVPMYTMCPLQNYHNIPYLVAVVGCTPS